MPEGCPVISSAVSANEPSSLFKPLGTGVTRTRNPLQGPRPRPGSCEVLLGAKILRTELCRGSACSGEPGLRPGQLCTELSRASAYSGEPGAEAWPAFWSPARPLVGHLCRSTKAGHSPPQPGPSHWLMVDFSGQQDLNRNSHMWLLVPVLGSISLEHSSPALSGRTAGKV